MGSTYDENLQENEFYLTLKTKHENIFQQAIYENWIICIPCSESLEQYELSEHNLLTHILIPNDELPDTHFRNLNDHDVKIHDKLVRLLDYPGVPILFSESYYADEARYKVFCLEGPLNSGYQSKISNPRLYCVKTFQDCVSLLSQQCSSTLVIKKIDEIVKQFMFLTSKNYFSISLSQQVEFVRGIYSRCLQIVTGDKQIAFRMKSSQVFMENVQIAVESYLLHTMYPIIMKGLITNVASEIGQFNRTLRNLSNIQLQHLKVVDTLFDSILKARSELTNFSNYTTVLGKLSCFKRCINLLSDQRHEKLCVDELLPILVFLVVKSGITTWIAQLRFIKEFSFSQVNYDHANESGFLVTTLEAILTFIQSGLFYKSIYSSEFNLIKMADGESDVCTYICSKSKLFWKTKHPVLLNLFQHIYNDDLKGVVSVLTIDGAKNESEQQNMEFQYCHPLCSCDKCEKLFSLSKLAVHLSVNTVNETGYNALHVAACYGKYSVVDWLLNNGAKANMGDFFGSTALHCAAQHGYYNIVLLLIKKNADLETRDDDGNTPLHLASVNGHTDCVKALLCFAKQADAPLDVNIPNKDGDTALHLAVKYYHQEIAEILLNYNANPTLVNKHNTSAFELTESLFIKAILNEKYSTNDADAQISIVAKKDKLIIDKFRLPRDEFGVEPQTVDGVKNLCCLFKAVKDNDVKTMKKFLGFGGYDSGEDIVELPRDDYKCHPLCRCDNCLAPALEAGSNCSDGIIDDDDDDADDVFDRKMHDSATRANACDRDGFTALHVACKYGQMDAMQVLLDAGAKVNVRTYSQFLTPLHIVCIQNQLAAARILLLRNTCKVNMVDRSGNTAMHYACMAGNVKIVELLLKYRPELELRNCRGKTVLNEAEENLAYPVMRLVQSAKLDSKERSLCENYF